MINQASPDVVWVGISTPKPEKWMAEHMILLENFAKEIRRVRRGYFVQTLSRYFPMDSHYLIPSFPFLPRFLQLLIYDKFGGWWKVRSQQYEDIY